MLIKEMLDAPEPGKKELGYDLKDDLTFFMNNDPDFYRKDYFPTMLKFKKYCKNGKNVQARAFESLVNRAYEVYQNKFQVEGLEDKLDKDMCEAICSHIHETETKNIEEGHYD
jgi:hypothetical protein